MGYFIGAVIFFLFLLEMVYKPRFDISEDGKFFLWYNEGQGKAKHRTYIRII